MFIINFGLYNAVCRPRYTTWVVSCQEFFKQSSHSKHIFSETDIVPPVLTFESNTTVVILHWISLPHPRHSSAMVVAAHLHQLLFNPLCSGYLHHQHKILTHWHSSKHKHMVLVTLTPCLCPLSTNLRGKHVSIICLTCMQMSNKLIANEV